ncbi:hypothetical protein FIBSPDRAFT_873009 [Athelia psychrophila]|uniref:Uncharacterized protein n=1 Tax=Athelia psychrophila TaxID=1759441 RepID=A0A165YYS1_9AGAM|nr:hypothetical protein FIBSPDRAFT_873009 [Fibularhizoctonia sp. CBS 109695]
MAIALRTFGAPSSPSSSPSPTTDAERGSPSPLTRMDPEPDPPRRWKPNRELG